MFRTEGASDRLITTGKAPPKKLRFIKPVEQTVSAEDLPATVRYKKGYLVVKRLTDKGFTVDEAGAKGIEIEAEWNSAKALYRRAVVWLGKFRLVPDHGQVLGEEPTTAPLFGEDTESRRRSIVRSRRFSTMLPG